MIENVLTEIHAAIVPDPRAVPARSGGTPPGFGLAHAALDGTVTGVGDWELPFAVQSIAKVFGLALVLAADGEQLWRRVGRQPSTERYDALAALDGRRGIPHNPFVNAGALVVVDRLHELTGDAMNAVRRFLRAEAGDDGVDFDRAVARAELEHRHRNAAIAHVVADHGNLRNPVAEVLRHYAWQCALTASCRQLAVAGLFLARGGVRADGERLLSSGLTKRLNAALLTCGTYDAAGDFAYTVGLPAKSGVGGGILAVMPGRGALCAWSPVLDASGNSVAGVDALGRFTTRTGWSVF
ncbi:glutaminase A [Pilimelia anulata]|nr:glutaminase A [Pilimelia anulata]